MASTPVYQVGGLSSGIDTMAIVDQYTSLRRRPLDLLKQRQQTVNSQVSQMGTIISQFTSLGSFTRQLSSDGVRASKVESTNTSFSAIATPKAANGTFNMRVHQLADIARSRSASFSSADAEVTGGDLTITAAGTTKTINIADGMKLSDVAIAINGAGLRIQATVLNSTTGSYLQITTKDTGYDPSGVAADALQIVENSTGGSGQPLGIATLQTARNAVVEIDGLQYERRTNVVDDVLTGVTVKLKSAGAAESLVVSDDTDGTAVRMQAFVDGLNAVGGSLDALLTADPATKKVGLNTSSGLRSAKQSLLRLVTTDIINSGSFKRLTDLGVSLDKSGKFTFDDARFKKALQSDPDGINQFFRETGTGLTSTVSRMVDQYTLGVSGILNVQKKSLQDMSRRMTNDAERMQRNVDAYRATLLQQFQSMESSMSSLKTTEKFLKAKAQAEALQVANS